ncbi:MAG: oxidoreductase C-terminal domain-containing protein [Acetobacteraceae bacterium]
MESWRSSIDQGLVAAQAMLGAEVSFDDVPTLWSDQYETNIQAVGFPELAARHEVLGDPQSGAWTWVALDEAGVVIGGVAINRGRDASGLKRAVKQKAGLAFLLPRGAPHAARSAG